MEMFSPCGQHVYFQAWLPHLQLQGKHGRRSLLEGLVLNPGESRGNHTQLLKHAQNWRGRVSRAHTSCCNQSESPLTSTHLAGEQDGSDSSWHWGGSTSSLHPVTTETQPFLSLRLTPCSLLLLTETTAAEADCSWWISLPPVLPLHSTLHTIVSAIFLRTSDSYPLPTE